MVAPDDIRIEPDRSVCRDRQADEWIIADGRDAFQRDVASALDSPLDGMDHPPFALEVWKGEISARREVPQCPLSRLVLISPSRSSRFTA